IPLAVGDDDAIGFRIEIHRRREAEAIFRLQTAHPTTSFHHVGVGVDAHLAPLGHHLGIADEIGDGAALGVEDADPMIPPVGHVDVARLIESDPPGLVELSVPAPGLTALRHELPLAREYLKSIVPAVDDDDVAVLLARQARGSQELTVAAARLAPLPLKLAFAVEH